MIMIESLGGIAIINFHHYSDYINIYNDFKLLIQLKIIFSKIFVLFFFIIFYSNF